MGNVPGFMQQRCCQQSSESLCCEPSSDSTTLLGDPEIAEIWKLLDIHGGGQLDVNEVLQFKNHLRRDGDFLSAKMLDTILNKLGAKPASFQLRASFALAGNEFEVGSDEQGLIFSRIRDYKQELENYLLTLKSPDDPKGNTSEEQLAMSPSELEWAKPHSATLADSVEQILSVVASSAGTIETEKVEKIFAEVGDAERLAMLQKLKIRKLLNQLKKCRQGRECFDIVSDLMGRGRAIRPDGDDDQVRNQRAITTHASIIGVTQMPWAGCSHGPNRSKGFRKVVEVGRRRPALIIARPSEVRDPWLWISSEKFHHRGQA
jgi:hypothetical protein